MPVTKRPRRPAMRKRATTANAARGEHALTLAGVTYVLRPTFAAINAIEMTLEPLIVLFRKANSCALGYDELGVIVGALIRAAAAEGDEGAMTRAVSDERIAELIYEEGSTRVFATLVLVLADAIGGGRDTSGEVRAVTGTTTAA